MLYVMQESVLRL